MRVAHCGPSGLRLGRTASHEWGAWGWAIGIHRHARNRGTPADETLTGLDHFALAVAGRHDLELWAERLDEQGVQHSGVIDTTDPMPYSVVVFRDPDNIQLELVHLPG